MGTNSRRPLVGGVAAGRPRLERSGDLCGGVLKVQGLLCATSICATVPTPHRNKSPLFIVLVPCQSPRPVGLTPSSAGSPVRQILTPSPRSAKAEKEVQRHFGTVLMAAIWLERGRVRMDSDATDVRSTKYRGDLLWSGATHP